MHSLLDSRELFDSLTRSDEEDEFMTSWINTKSIGIYNRMVESNQPTEIVQGSNGYAVFNNFKYENITVPYMLKITNGLNDKEQFDIAFSPTLFIPSIFVRIKSSELPPMHKYYNVISLREFSYILGDNLDLVMLVILDIMKYKLSKKFKLKYTDSRDYENSVTNYMMGYFSIKNYILALNMHIHFSG